MPAVPGGGGGGAFWGSQWLQLQWPQAIQLHQIAIKELIPIALACALWGINWKGTRVRANGDNEAVVAVLNSGYSRDQVFMHLLKCIFFFCARFDFRLSAEHIPGHLNRLADAISWNDAPYFLSSYSQANPDPTPISPEMIWVLLIERADWTSNDWTLWFHTTFAHL